MRAIALSASRLRWPLLALVALVATHVALALIWVGTHELPTGTRDEFFVVAETLDIAWQLEHIPWSQLDVYPLLIMKSYYPPLCRLPGVLALLMGGGYDAMIIAQWLWIPFLVAGTWIAARTFLGAWASVAAVALLLAGPAVQDTLHRYEPNLGAMAMAACVLAAWLHSDDLRRRRESLLMGLFLGMGLLTDRLGVVPFLIAPVVVSLARTDSRKATLRGLGMLTVAALLVAGWWYIDFFERFARELVPQLFGGEISAVGMDLEDRPPLPLWWLHYLVLWPDSQLGLIGGTCALAGLGWALKCHRQPAVRNLLLWLGGGLLLFTLVQKRQPFYTLALLPVAAIFAAAGLQAAARRLGAAGAVIGALVVAAATLPAVITSQEQTPDVPPGLRDWILNSRSPLPESWIGERFPLGAPPQDVGLRIEGSLDLLEKQGLGEDDLVLVFSDDGLVNESAMWSFGRIHRGNQQVLGLTLDPQGIFEHGHRARALIFVHDTPGSWPQDRNLIAAHERFFGFEEETRPLLPLVRGLRAGATLVEERRLRTETTLSTWLLEGASP